MKSIAITGGIGAGKSTVTSYFINSGYDVIDADKMARSLTEPGGRAIPYIIDNFGQEYIAVDGSMDRSKMKKLVFSDEEALKILEQGTTQLVLEDIQTIKERASLNNTEILFFDIPLLFEKGMEHNFDIIMLVYASVDVRRQRVMVRDNISEKMFNDIINSQISDDYKLKHSDIVILNNGSIEQLYEQLDYVLYDIEQNV